MTAPTPSRIELSELAERLRLDNGYAMTRVLPDGSIAGLTQLITTVALTVGMNQWGWEKRFCFRTWAEAIEQYHALRSEDDEPTGFVARRPELRDADGHYIGAVGQRP